MAWFTENSLARAQTIAFLTNIADLERIINRITGNLAGPNELVALKRTLSVIPKLKEALGNNADSARYRLAKR